jgi:dihydrofolate reductase
MTITIIAATTASRVIADSKSPGMLWHNKAELAHFKRETIGKTCIAGLKTAIAMPILKEREIYVLIDGMSPRCDISNYPENYHFLLSETIDAQLCMREFIDSDDEIMVIGGAKTYAAFMDSASKAIISTIFDSNGDIVGDVYLPNFIGCWKLVKTKVDVCGEFMTQWFERVS